MDCRSYKDDIFHCRLRYIVYPGCQQASSQLVPGGNPLTSIASKKGAVPWRLISTNLNGKLIATPRPAEALGKAIK